MKKLNVIKAIANNDQLILCESGSGLSVRFVKINFIKETKTGKLVFKTEAGDKVILKEDEFEDGKYNACDKYSDCWLTMMSDVENDKNYYECGSIAF